MNQTERMHIRLVVENEESLYNHLSAEDEFSEAVKKYLRAKTACRYDHQGIALTVMSREPVNEERFLSAKSNWIREEKALFQKSEKDFLLALVVHLILGSVLIILSLSLIKKAEWLSHSLLPIFASICLGKAAEIMVTGLPSNGRAKELIREVEQNSLITFAYGREQNQGCGEESAQQVQK